MCAAALIAIGLLAPVAARADVKLTVNVWLIASDQRYCWKREDNGKLDCHILPHKYPALYAGGHTFRSSVEGNVTEQIVDAAQLGINIFKLQQAIAAALAAGAAGQPWATGVASAEAIRQGYAAYDEFRQLMDSWGGRSVFSETDFIVTNPNGIYNTVEFVVTAESDDDMLTALKFAPGEIPGITIASRTDRSKYRSIVVRVDLAKFAALGPKTVLPLAFSTSENKDDCSVSCLAIGTVVSLNIFPAETKPISALTSATFQRLDLASCDVCGFTRTIDLMRNTVATGEQVQQATLRIRQSFDGKNRIWADERWQEYEVLGISMTVKSLRPRPNDGTRVPLVANCVGTCPSGITLRGGSLSPGSATENGLAYTTQGEGSATALITPKVLPAGTYTLVFNGSFEPGGLIAQHQVKIVKVVERVPIGNTNVANPCRDDGTCGGGGVRPMTGASLAPVSAAAILAGDWKDGAGAVIRVKTASGGTTWVRVGTALHGTFSIVNGVVVSTWTEGSRTLTARGRVTKSDAQGKPIRIEWTSGAVYSR